jgi:hypothetical protein
VFFSNAYFQALEDSTRDPDELSRAWAPLFAAREEVRVAPIQFALAGMNAHINYDLPIGVRDTCLAFDVAPRDGTPQHRDYLRLNSILASVQERVKVWLATGLLRFLDRLLGDLDDLVASFSVMRARDAAWVHSQALWTMRDKDDLAAAYLDTLEHTVGLAGHGLVAPTLLGLGRWASAQRWLPGEVGALLGAPRAELAGP